MKLLSNFQFAASVAALFLAATFAANLNQSTTGTGRILLTSAAVKSSPTLPPDPWTEPPRKLQSSPTLPPDPWTEPPTKFSSPTLPPDPWTEPPAV